jgi:biopolymer transport protein ExbD
MGGEMRAEPNLTPLLDVVFQLITFFMLLINFSNDNYDQRVRLPVAGSARPVEDAEQVSDDRLVLNVDREGHLLSAGQVMPTQKATSEIRHQAEIVKFNLKAIGVKYDPAKGLPTMIVLRADRDTTFSTIYPLIVECQNQGFRKFSLKAMSGS